MIRHEETIVAIATPIGEGGISVVRISGSQAFQIIDRSFRGKQQLSSALTHTAHFGKIVSPTDNILDEVIVTVFKSPHSYTGEDVVEISCHGGVFVTNSILNEMIINGARIAEPGEFTKRAFLNGKIDLSQAEAVADLIRAKTEASHQTSIQQLQARLSLEINILRQKIINLISLIELELDFSEERLELIERRKILSEINDVEESIKMMLNSYNTGKIFREGAKVVLAGRPNVGKSSILNRLLNTNRAIVTDIPGTTRDIIEESVNINGVLFNIADTAGLRQSNDLVEREGISRTKDQIKYSNIVLFIIDLSDGYTDNDKLIISKIIQDNSVISNNLLIVENKYDLISHDPIKSVEDNNLEKAVVSAKTGYGFDRLKNKIYDMVLGDSKYNGDRSVVITNIRHFNNLKICLISLEDAKKTLNSNYSGEFIVAHLRSGLYCLEEIIGAVTSDDIINNIFSKFCIGK